MEKPTKYYNEVSEETSMEVSREKLSAGHTLPDGSDSHALEKGPPHFLFAVWGLRHLPVGLSSFPCVVSLVGVGPASLPLSLTSYVILRPTVLCLGFSP